MMHELLAIIGASLIGSVQKIEGCFAVGCFQTKPDEDAIGSAVDGCHSLDLMVPFRSVGLVDTQGIDPQQSWSDRESQMHERLKQICSDVEGRPINQDDL